MTRITLAIIACLTAVQGFTTVPTSCNVRHAQHITPLSMVATSNEMFGDDMPERIPERRSKSDQGKVREGKKRTPKFVNGDELHRLRHQVLAMRLELQETRRSGDNDRVRELETAIMKAQQVDAEFVYTVSSERQELAEKKGMFREAEAYKQQAIEARAALPHFNLEGLWVGKYGEHGYEMINVTYRGDVLIASKVTGTKNVPKGEVTFEVDLSPNVVIDQGEVLEPIELGDEASKQWGCKYLQRFAGKGQVAADGYLDSQWIEGQLIMVNEYFSFAWLPIGHQVFFGRPTPELILKLVKDDKKKEVGGCDSRAFLEKCWEETEHIEDHIEVDRGRTMESINQLDHYDQDGCFE